MATQKGTVKAPIPDHFDGPWDSSLDKLREWDPAWAETPMAPCVLLNSGHLERERKLRGLRILEHGLGLCG
jgi:hypothetical protein